MGFCEHLGFFFLDGQRAIENLSKGLGMCFKIMTLAVFWMLGWREILRETMHTYQEGHF